MRKWLCQLVILAVLTVSFEGVVVVEAGHEHGEQPYSALETSHSPAHDDSGSGPGPEQDHCGHYCHGHLTNVGLTPAMTTPRLYSPLGAAAAVFSTSAARAPPTPPPNA